MVSLIFCQSFVQDLGIITVYSEPDKGTTFHIYLPRITYEEGAVDIESVETFPPGHERVLFIDDEQALVNIGKQMLEHVGYEVVARTSSGDALELFRDEPERFDIVITDMTMPNMTGDRLAKELMQIRPDIPIILCTGFSETISGKKAKEMGIRAFVMKPYLLQDVAKTIREVLDETF